VIGWIDGSAGASGDMLLGALVDAGVPVDVLQDAVGRLSLGIELAHREVVRGSFRAVHVDVGVSADPQPHRCLADVLTLLEPLDEAVRDVAREVFQRLAAAEARVHGESVEAVHFHEVGAIDAIADVVGVAAGFCHLGLETLHAGPLALGSGTGEGSHGSIPIPGPAVLELLRGAPIHGGSAPFEATTPTGAALLATLVNGWGSLPPMVLEQVGHGAGTRDPVEHPNVLRLTLGTPPSASGAGSPTATLLETNIDDMDPRLWPRVIDRLLAAGASDAWLTPIQMKKGRPAFTLSVLVADVRLADVRDGVFRETTTIGLRELTVGKVALERSGEVVHVDGQPIAVKVASRNGEVLNRSVEWEDVVAAAETTRRPANEVLARATAEVLGRPRPSIEQD